MMERVLLSVLYLSGWLIPSKCHEYQFFNNPLNWSEANDYCRQTSTRLATIVNTTEIKLENTVLFSKQNSVWIDLYYHVFWSSSNDYSEDYLNSENQKTETAPFSVRFFCGSLSSNELWWNNNCSTEHPFICYKGTQLSPNYVFVKESMDWFRALRYCRENFTDLASSWDSDVQSLVPNSDRAWIGLFGEYHNHWTPEFGFWDDFPQKYDSENALCGVADFQRSGKWRLLPCGTNLPFFCYSLEHIHVEYIHKKVIKLSLKIEDSSVDLSDSTVKAELLKKFQETLKKKGVNGTTLKWREQPDGKVFHKEEENTEKEGKKKTEL